MDRKCAWAVFILIFLINSCSPDEVTPQQPLTREARLQKNIDSLQTTARSGDLLVRLTDDIISRQVSTLNERDKSYSHCGMVVEKPNGKFVYDIAPNAPGADTIELIPLDTFISPAKHIKAALFRYQLSSLETDSLIRTIEAYKTKDVRFDVVYDLATDDKMYCSEMLSKALTIATNGKMKFRVIPVPEKMMKLMLLFFKNQHITPEIIKSRRFVSLDNLYLRPDCKELMQFDLKIFPGQQ